MKRKNSELEREVESIQRRAEEAEASYAASVKEVEASQKAAILSKEEASLELSQARMAIENAAASASTRLEHLVVTLRERCESAEAALKAMENKEESESEQGLKSASKIKALEKAL